MSNEEFQYCLQQIEYRYGKEMKRKIEVLHQKGYLGMGLLQELSGQPSALPINLGRLGALNVNVEQKSRRM